MEMAVRYLATLPGTEQGQKISEAFGDVPSQATGASVSRSCIAHHERLPTFRSLRKVGQLRGGIPIKV